jgi:hypothetical protein
MNDPSIKNIVDNTLAEVYASNIGFSSLIDENLDFKKDDDIGVPLTSSVISATDSESSSKSDSASESAPNSGMMNDLLKTFGGQVIN